MVDLLGERLKDLSADLLRIRVFNLLLMWEFPEVRMVSWLVIGENL